MPTPAATGRIDQVQPSPLTTSQLASGQLSNPYDPADCRLALDRSTPVPLWAQIADYLAVAIADHRLLAGQPIGSEEELARRFSVSRATIRKALATIAERGLITRSRAAGTRVEIPGHRSRTALTRH